jgi:2-oxoglutarate dehydrogenase E1 component
VALCRVEQLAPFPRVALLEALNGYPSLEEVVWLQEEPENMGAWDWVRGQLDETIQERASLRFIGRVRSSSPSEGSAAWHQINQRILVDEAFSLESRPLGSSTVLSKAVRSLITSKR